MKYSSFLLTIFLCSVAVSLSAQSLKGRVVDAQTNKPLAKASVYINSSTIGTSTNENGEFILEKCPAVKFELVASYVGYQTAMTTVTMPFEGELVMKLAPGATEMKAVVVRNYQKDGWKQWGTYFLDNFLGSSSMAKQCRIKNTRDLRFSWSNKSRQLYVISVNPLGIENKALGYTVEYDLESFHSDFNTHHVYYQGYPRYIEMKGSAARQKRWQANRKKVYEGSVMHFFRSVYKGDFERKGFQVRKLVKTPNLEKQRVRQLYREKKVEDLRDSSHYYENVLSQPDQFSVLYRQPLPLSYFAGEPRAGLQEMQFTDYLVVSYIHKKPPDEYYLQRRMMQRDTCLQSEIVLNQAPSIQIVQSGNYYEPAGLLFSNGYWGWFEKVSAMLPLDYEE